MGETVNVKSGRNGSRPIFYPKIPPVYWFHESVFYASPVYYYNLIVIDSPIKSIRVDNNTSDIAHVRKSAMKFKIHVYVMLHRAAPARDNVESNMYCINMYKSAAFSVVCERRFRTVQIIGFRVFLEFDNTRVITSVISRPRRRVQSHTFIIYAYHAFKDPHAAPSRNEGVVVARWVPRPHLNALLCKPYVRAK